MFNSGNALHLRYLDIVHYIYIIFTFEFRPVPGDRRGPQLWLVLDSIQVKLFYNLINLYLYEFYVYHL